MPSQNGPKEYVVSVNTDEVREAIRMTASALYAFIEEALATTEDEDEFEIFVQDVLGVLTRHADQLTDGESSWGQRADEESTHD